MHGGKYYETKWRRRTAARWAMRRSTPVAVSEATREHLEISLGLPSGSVTVIHNGIRFSPGDRRLLREELALHPDEPLIVAIGNLYPVKGHQFLFDALHQVSERHPEMPWRLALAGRGEEEAALLRRADELGIASRVHLLGFRSDVADILAAADVYAMPSLSEGMPLALLEAMFSRKAIIASDVGGIPEVVTHSESALLVPPSDAGSLSQALEGLLGDPELRQSLAETAFRRAELHFSVKAMMDDYERMYFGSTATDSR